MPLPQEYQRASDQFYSFLTELRDLSNFGSSHQTYTMVQGVFQVFRRRLQINDAIKFADTLPAILCAIFVSDWDTDEPIKSFCDLSEMNKEVKQLRTEHNFSTDTAIQDVRTVLIKYVDKDKFARVIRTLPVEAQQFWGWK
ncbi:DUF2267 domain-containing protein [Pseudohongiella spirulinae]|uniref:DUF2267 domain-containing protein n=1 Tax=Pseudohongiella spirulinae TaxID=1249552 RepID=A0A0S2K9H6_9GAMM|nr:DUF2267 domain-containing protein [Pseudohongiella spirulinae]ALO44873.1 hypothetical protein PS2015_179 [Pseudohongiella spirulinae]